MCWSASTRNFRFMVAASACGLAMLSSHAVAGPVLTEPTGSSVRVDTAELDAQLADLSITPADFKALSLPAPAVDPLASPQAELPPVIPLPPAVIPGLVVLGLVIRACRKAPSARAAR